MDQSNPPASDPPAGYKPLFRTSPFLDHNGRIVHASAVFARTGDRS